MNNVSHKPLLFALRWATILSSCLSSAIAIAQSAGQPSAQAATAEPGVTGRRQNDRASEPGKKRLEGLRIGENGFTTGPGGGLDLELSRNDDLPPLPPLPSDVPQPSPDPRNFEGAWFGDQFLAAFEIRTDMYGEDVPFTDLGRSIADRRLLANDRRQSFMTPTFLCRPSGPDWSMIHMPVRIYQSKDRVDVFSTMDRMWWPIAVNPALLPDEKTKTYMGLSRAHWEGDVLVVENSDFKVRRWLSFRGTPISPAGKLTYHISKKRQDGRQHLEIVTTVDDSAYYRRPWKFARTLQWRPDAGLLAEYDCEDQAGLNDSGAVPEPE